MKHIIRITHMLTEGQRYVFLSCEENGNVLFVSDKKKNGMFHLTGTTGAPLRPHPFTLFDAADHTPLFHLTLEPTPHQYRGLISSAGDVPCGSATSVGSGSKRYYTADLYGHHYDCYSWAVGTNPCFMFYMDGIQRGMLVEDKLSVNRRYSMTLHVADSGDVTELCMLSVICHLFENVYNMNSRFRRAFIRNGYYVAFSQHTANYHFEVPLYGAGKSKYDVHFLRQFYPEDSFPYQDDTATAKAVVEELGHGLREATGEAWRTENLKSSLRNPVAIALLVGIPVLCGIIGCFIAPLILLSFGINIYTFSPVAVRVIGFLALFAFTGGGELIFLLFFFLLCKIFGKKD